MSTTIEIKGVDEISPDVKRKIDDWYEEVFSKELEMISDWAPAEWIVLTWDGEKLVSVIELLKRKVRVRGAVVRVGGVGGIYTLPAYRQQGHVKRGLDRAMAFLCQDAKFALLVCNRRLVEFYKGMDWHSVKSPVIYQQEDGRHRLPDEFATMVFTCGEEHWPGGEIDLQGPPW